MTERRESAASPESLPLQEFRCGCGKLLFRGTLLLSVVEIKCRRCGAMVTENGFDGPIVFFDASPGGEVTGVFGDPARFGIDRRYVLGKNITEVCTAFRDAAPRSPVDTAYRIRSGNLVLKDGGRMPVETVLLQKTGGGSLAVSRLIHKAENVQ